MVDLMLADILCSYRGKCPVSNMQGKLEELDSFLAYLLEQLVAEVQTGCRSSDRSGPVNRMDDDWPGDSEVI